jgi:arabinofuranosyltransferase
MLLSTVFLIAAASIAETIAPWSGVLIAATGYFYHCFGMETTLFLFMLALSLWFYLQQRYFWLPLICLLTVLTRAEGIFIVAPIVWQLWRKKQIPQLSSFIAPGMVIAAYLAFNYHFYGRVMPASASAKFEQGFSGYWGAWPTAFLHHGSALLEPFRASIYVIPAAIVLAALALRKLRGSPINAIVLPFLLGLFAFYLLLNVPNYHWYDAPFAFFGLIYAVLGLPRNRIAYGILAVVIAECAVTAFFELRRLGPLRHYEQAAQWLETHSAPDAKIAAVEIGTIGWNCDRNVDDIIGLTNPANAKLLAHHDLTSWLEQDKPDYVVVHDEPAFGEKAAAASPLYENEPVHASGIRIMHRKVSPR